MAPKATRPPAGSVSASRALVPAISMLRFRNPGYGRAMTGFALACLWACAASAIAAAAGSARSRGLSRISSVVMAAGAAIPTAVLAKALWSLDLSLTYVADHARAGTSGFYRLSGLWGGASGSLLMFTAMVAAAVAVLVWTQPRPTARSAALWGSLSVAVLAGAVLSTANPFRRLAIPAIEGAGLQPILEHPAMLYHPPLLYLGQVSTIVPFLVAVAAPLGPNERRALRGWLGLSLALLTAGLATGSNWGLRRAGMGRVLGLGPGGERDPGRLAAGPRGDARSRPARARPGDPHPVRVAVDPGAGGGVGHPRRCRRLGPRLRGRREGVMGADGARRGHRGRRRAAEGRPALGTAPASVAARRLCGPRLGRSPHRAGRGAVSDPGSGRAPRDRPLLRHASRPLGDRGPGRHGHRRRRTGDRLVGLGGARRRARGRGGRNPRSLCPVRRSRCRRHACEPRRRAAAAGAAALADAGGPHRIRSPC